MDLDAADPHDGQKYTAQEWAEWAEWMASDEYEKEEPQEDLDYLGKGGSKGGKGKGKKGKGGKSGKGKGCHWCGDEDHFKADCPKFKAWKKKKDEERAARGEKPFEPRARQAPLKSMDAVIDIDDGYVGFGMLEEEPELVPLKSLAPEIPEAVVVSSEVVVIHKVAAKKARVSGPASFPADFAGDCYELTVSQRDGSSSTAEYVSREVAPPTDEPDSSETHGLEESFPEARGGIEPGMDIDIIEEHVDTDLKELMAVLRRDERLEIEETNREIMSVFRSLGADDVDGQLWDFDSNVMRDQAFKKIREERPRCSSDRPCVQRSAHGRGSTTKSDVQ